MRFLTVPEHLTLIAGEVVVSPIYTCMRCGARASGDRYKINILRVETTRLEARHMPVGWASFTEGYACHRCQGGG